MAKNPQCHHPEIHACFVLLPAIDPHASVALLRTTLRADWKPAGYPCVINHLGEHIRKRRMDLGLQVKQLAGQLGVDEQSLSGWELGHRQPSIAYLPHVIRFLGYDPRQVPQTRGARLMHFRTAVGLSQNALAKQLRVDPSTLRRWESGRRTPEGELLTRINSLLRRKGW